MYQPWLLAALFNTYYICCVAAGVIDVDYRGPIGVVLFNLAKTDYNGMCLSVHFPIALY